MVAPPSGAAVRPAGTGVGVGPAAVWMPRNGALTLKAAVDARARTTAADLAAFNTARQAYLARQAQALAAQRAERAAALAAAIAAARASAQRAAARARYLAALRAPRPPPVPNPAPVATNAATPAAVTPGPATSHMTCVRSADGNSVTCTSGTAPNAATATPSPAPSPAPSSTTPIMAATLPATPVAATAVLTQAQLDAAVAQAKSEWLAVDPQADFTGFTASVGNLAAGWLGSEGSGAVVIDALAAGWGWDVTFPTDPAAAHMDLLTVVRHELGHVLGLQHTPGTVMTATLAPGESYPVDAALLAALAPTAPAPSTPAPTSPAPSTPAPTSPAPSTPAPTTPAPTTPAPSTPAPSTPAPTTPAPTAPAPWSLSLNGTGTLAFHSDGTVSFGNLTQPLAALSEIDVQGGPGDDTLIVDRGTANPAITVRFDGGAGFNTLDFAGTATRVVSQPLDAHAGTVLLDATTVVYTNIAPMNTGSAAAALFDLGSSTATCTLANSPTAGELRISCPGSSEVTDFVTPTASLTLQGTGNLTVDVSGTVNLGAGVTLTISARTIALDTGLDLTSGDLTLTASQTVTGGITNGLTCLVHGTVATHCADAEVTLTGATVHAGNVTISATGTVTPDSFYGIVVSDTAGVTITDGLLHATGAITVSASSTLPTFTANEKYTDNLILGSKATITVNGGAQISGGAAATFTSTSTVNGTANPGADASKNQGGTGADGSPQKDAAVATVTVFSTSTTALTGAATLSATGSATLAAANHVNVAATADASAASNGAGIAIIYVHQDTNSYIDSNSTTPITAANLAVNADSDTSSASTANTSAAGASANDKDANDPSRANGASKTADGSVGLTAALAVVVLSGGTHAYIAPATGSLTVTTTAGTQTVHAGAKNVDTSNASGGNANGTGGSGSVGVGVAVTVGTFTTEAYIGGNTTLNAATLTVEAVPPTASGQSQYGASAESGAAGSGGDAVSLAGSVAVNIVVLHTLAEIRGTPTINANANLTGTSNLRDRGDAKSKKDGSGNSIGIGASVAIDVVNDTTNAGIVKDASVTGVHDLVLRATGTSDSQTTATTGAAGGSSLVLTAGVALNVDNITTTAGIAAGPDESFGGKIDALANQSATSKTTATGATDGGNLAIGVAIAITLAKHRADSSTARNATTATDATFEADGSSSTDTESTASSKGAKAQQSGSNPTGDTTSVNNKGDQQAGFANTTSTTNGGDGTRTTTPAAKSGDNGGTSITVAAAISFNMVDATTTSELAPGARLTATAGKVALTTKNTTHATTVASGTASTGSSLTVGAAVAINLVNIQNEASIGVAAGVTALTGLGLSATMNTVPDGTNAISATATSGASSSDGTLGLAGSFAMNLLNEKTVAALHADNTAAPLGGLPGVYITGVGDIAMTAGSSNTSTTKAMAEQSGGATLGIGASVALNLINNDVFTGFDPVATPATGPPVTGARNITLTSTNTDSLTNETDGGGQGGKVTIVPSVAVSIANESSTAAFGAGPLVQTSGQLSASATFTGTVTTTAKGDTTVGSTAGIGMSLALAIVNHTADAHTSRSLHATGAITLTASGSSAVNSDAEAAANGSKDDGSGQNSNKKADDNLANANSTQSANNTAGKDSGQSSTPQDGTADGKSKSGSSSLSVAAAFAVNVVTTQSLAYVGDALKINSDTGVLTVTSSANTNSFAHGKGDTTAKASLGIGVGVGVNAVHITNHASVGASTIVATGLDVEAGMTDIADPNNHAVLRHWNGTGWDVIDRGKQLPGPYAGAYFVLTAKDGSNDIGVYKYNGGTGNWDAQTPTATAPPSGDTFPASPSTNDWFTLTKAKDGHPQGSLYQWDGTTWQYRTSDSGAKLPTGGPKDKDYFELLAGDGLGHAAGLYRFSSSGHAWNTIAGPFAHGVALPASPTTDQIFRLDEHEMTAQAEAGASGDPSSVGIASAVSLNLIYNNTEAVVPAGADVTLTTGDLTLKSRSNERDASKATAKAEVGDAVGVGASVAMNFMFDSTANRVRSEVEDGATLSGGANIVIEAVGFRQVETEVEAGTESGSKDPAITPAVALTISNHDHVIARLGSTPSTSALTATGAVTVSAEHTSEYSAQGDGEAASGDVAIGAVVALNVVLDWQTTAAVDQSVTAASFAISATSEVSDTASAKATAKGTQDNSKSEGKNSDSTADSKTNQEVTGSPTGSSGTGGATTPNSNSQAQSANSSSSGSSGGKGGGTGIAAAIAVNWIDTTNSAGIGSGVTVHANSGDVEVTASNLSTATTKAIGIAADLSNDTSIGAAVSLDVQTMSNAAEIGTTATVTGAGISVQAITPGGKHDDFVIWAIAAAAAKEDAGVAGSAGIHVLNLTTTASVGQGATLTSTAGVTVNATTDMRLLNLALTGALATSGAGIGGAFAVNIITSDQTQAYIDSATTHGNVTSVQASGAIAVTATNTFAPLAPQTGISAVDGYLPALSSVAVGGAAGGDGAAVSLTVVVDVFSFDTEAYINDGAQINQTTTGDGTQTVAVQAQDNTTVKNIAGSVALSLGSASVGGSIIVDIVSKDVRARIGSSAHVNAGGDITVSATATESMLEVAAGASASTGSAAIQGSINVIVLNPGTHSTAATIDTNAVVHSLGNVTVSASDTADKLSIISGNVAISTGGAGVGASAAILVRDGTVTATIGAGASVEADGSAGLSVTATQTVNLLITAIAGAGGDSAGVGGSVTVDVLTDHTTASIGTGALINCAGLTCTNSSANATQAAVVHATDTTTVLALAGALAVGGTAGVGVGVDVEDLHKTTIASIGDSATVHANGDVVVKSGSSEDIKSISVGGSFGGTAAVSVNAAIPVITVTTTASIGNSTEVRAGGNVIVSADEALTLAVVAGNISVGGTAAVGAGVAVPVVTKTTSATIGTNSTVTGRGIAGHITNGTVNAGSYGTTGIDPRFDPRGDLGGWPTAPPNLPPAQGLLADGVTIDLGYRHGFSLGQQVVYDAGGGAPITGLTDGGTYYAIPVSDTAIQLYRVRGPPAAPTCADPNLVCAMALPAGVRMGENQRFVPTTDPGVKADNTKRFNAATDVASNYIVLPYDFGSKPPKAGDPVVYSAGGGTPIGGLVDGATYYVVDPSPDHFQIAASYCDAVGVNKGPDGICQSSPKNGGGTSLGGDDSAGGTVNVISFSSTGAGRSQSFVPAGVLPAGSAADLGSQTITGPSRSGFQGVAVAASNSDYIASIGIAAGVAGTAAVSLSGSVAVVTVHTTASIGDGTHINCAPGDTACSANDSGADPNQSLLVSAENNFRTLAIAASIAISGTAGVGASTTVRVVELHDDAYLGNNVVVNARNNIELHADSVDSVISVNAAAAGGTVGVAGTVGVSVIHEYTHAYTGTSDTIRADNNLGVFATSTTKLILITASIAAGYVGVGVGVGVAVVNKETQSYLGSNDVIIVKALGGGRSGVNDGTVGDGSLGMKTESGLTVQANSSEKLFGLVAGIGAGFVGVTGNVGVNIFTVDTQAFIAGGTTVNRGTSGIVSGVAAGQGVVVSGGDVFDSLTFAGGAAGGFVGASGGIDIGVAKISVLGQLGSGTDIWANGSVEVDALSSKHVRTYAVSVGGGFVGVAGAVSVWSVGTAPNATYSTDDHGPNRQGWNSGANYQSGDVVTYNSTTYIAKDNNTNKRPDISRSDWKVDNPQNSTSGSGSDGQSQADTVAAGNGGGWKSILGGAPTTPAFATATAYKGGQLVSYNGHYYQAQGNFTSTTTPDVDTADWVLSDNNYQVQVANDGASSATTVNGSYAATSPTQDQFSATNPAPVQCDPAHAPMGTASVVCGSVHSLQADVQVRAVEHLDVFALAGAVAGGAGAFGAGITIMTIGGNTDAGIYGGASVSAAGTVGVHAEYDENVTDIGVAGTAGGVAIGAQVVVLTDSSQQAAHIDDTASVPTAGTKIDVTALANRTLSAFAIGITLAAAGAGAAVSVIQVSGDTKALIGNVAIGDGGAIGGINVNATDNLTTTVLSVGVVAGAGLALSGIVSYVSYTGTTRAASFAHGTVPIGGTGVTVTATGTRSQLAPVAVNIAVGGGVSVGFTLVVAYQGRNTEAELGGSVSTSGAVEVQSSASDTASAYTPGAVIGAAAIAAMIPIAMVSGHTTATLSGTVGGSSTTTVDANGVKKADAEVDILNISGLGLSVGVAVATVTDGADIQATVSSGASIRATGAVQVTAETTTGDRNEALATGKNLSAALFASASIFAAVATLGGAVRSELDGTITGSGSVDVGATSVNHAETQLLVISAGGLGGIAVSISDAEIDKAAKTEALSVDAGNTQTISSSGAVTFAANSANTALTNTQMGSGGGLFGVSVNVPNSAVAGATNASVDGDVTATGLSVKSTGGNTATTTAILVSVGGLAGVAADVSQATITGDAGVNASVNGNSAVTVTGGDVLVSAQKTNTITTQTGSLSASGGLSVGVVGSDAEDHGGSSASFGGELAAANTLTVKTDAGDGMKSSLFVVSISFGLSIDAVSGGGVIDGTDTAYLAGSANIHSGGTAITVQAGRSALSTSGATGGAGGLLLGGAGIEADSHVGGTVAAYVGDGAVVGTTAGRPANLTVRSDDRAVAVASAQVVTGGAVSAGFSKGNATANPTVDAYLGKNVHVVLADIAGADLNIDAVSHAAEAVGTATNAGGGLISAGLPAAYATSTPKVHAYLDSGTTVITGGSVKVDAESNAEPKGTPLNDYIAAANADCGPNCGDTITFPSHGLNSGDQVLYNANGNPVIPGLHDQHIYSVLVVDQDTLRFGSTFSGAAVDATSLSRGVSGVDANRAMVRFAAPHHLTTGDAVIYRVATGGTSISSGFGDGSTLYVRVIDDYTIELYPTYAAATAAVVSFGTGSVSGNQISDSTLGDTSLVTYRSAPALTFARGAIDVNVDGSGKVTGDNSTAWNIYLAYVITPGQNPVIGGHGLTNGQRIVYRTSDATDQVGNLSNGGTYYVHVTGAFTIQLADSYCHAVGYSYDNSCVDGSSSPINVSVIQITRPSNDATVHAIAPDGIGPTDGYTYQVHRVDGSSITLRAVGGSTDIGLHTDLVYGDWQGNQQLFLAGATLQAATGGQQVYVKITGAMSGTTQKLLAADGSSLRAASPPPGNGVTAASARGGSGGGVSITVQTADVTIDPLAKAFDEAKSINAGQDVSITATTSIHTTASVSNGSGGVISGTSVESSIHNCKVDSDHPTCSNTLGNATSALIGSGSDAIDGTTTGPVDGSNVSITAGGNISVIATSTQVADASADTESGGLGGASHASASVGLTDRTAAVVGQGAQVSGSTVNVLATTQNSNITSEARSVFIAFIGEADANASSDLDSKDT
ncbi:MAG: hypothetical protein EPN43_04655, partial [Jatrophihabitans sp.]